MFTNTNRNFAAIGTKNHLLKIMKMDVPNNYNAISVTDGKN